MYTARTIKQVLLASIQQYPVVTVTGPRQAGKTTLLRNEFPNAQYVNLEGLRERQFADADPIGFLNQFSQDRVVIIDEVQQVPLLLSEIQVRVDAQKKNGLFILSGSQNLTLNEAITQSLAGRTSLLRLLPFSLAEADSLFTPARRSIDEALLQGGYPRILVDRLNPTEACSYYTQTYIERDVRALVKVHDLSLFQKFLMLCAGRIGQLLNKESLARDVGVRPSTIEEWLSILEATFIVFRLQPWHRNIGKRLIKSPKLYFYDTAIVCYLLGIETAQQLSRHPLRGEIFENMQVLEVLKHYFHAGRQPRFYFYRDSQDYEVDIVIEREGRWLPIEIKSSATFNTSFMRGIERFQKVIGDECDKPCVVLGDDHGQLRTNFNILPWFDIASVL